MIRIRCRCGEVFHAEEQHVGRVLNCRCGRTIPVRLPARRPDPPAPAKGAAPSAGAAWRRLRDGLRSALPPPGRGSGPLRWLAWATWGYAAAVGGVVAAVWLLAERWWPATVYLFGPRWLVLLPLALLVPLAAVFRPKLLLPLAAAAAVALFPVMGLRTGWRSWLAGGSSPDALRVVTLNAAGETWAGERLVARLEEWRPHLAAVQECTRPVAASLGRAAGWVLHRDGQLCLLSRLPVRDVEVMDRSRFDLVRQAGVGGSSSAVRYTVETPHGPVQLVNLHLETPRKGFRGIFRRRVERIAPNTLSRELESRYASRWAAQGVLPLVVAGDFNLPVESRIYRESWGGFGNAFSLAGRGFGFTRFNGWIRVRIDHVLAGPGWRVERAFVGPELGSDHRPVVADLVRTDGG